MSASYTYAPDPSQRQYSQHVHRPQPFTPPTGGQIAPGSITYTTSIDADGRTIYHPFRAVPASYQTPSGVVSGIQWVPADATQNLPPGAQPANAEFAASWTRGYLSGKDQKALKEWQKDEEKRRKREEKEATKRLREKEDSELRKARERDAYAQERRKSFNAGTAAPGIDPGYPNLRSGYGTTPHNNYSPAGSSVDLDRRFEEMGLRDEDKHRGSSYSNVYNPSHHSSTNPTYPPATRPPVYSSTGAAYGPSSRGPSPNMRPVDIPRSTTPVPGTMAGTSITGFPQATIPGHGGSPFTTPGGFPVEQQQLPAPDAFSRPVNAAQPYTPFETIKIQNMDDFVDKMPKMPLVLQPHDVYHEDWIRFMEDLTRAWTGTLPVPDLATGRTHKRSTLAGDLIDVWNKSFFISRGVEVALYKGREKRSGPGAGTIDHRLPAFDTDTSSSSSSSDSSDLSGDERYGQSGYGQYGRQSHGQSESEARRRHKAEKKRLAKEKKHRKKAKEREKTYALYLICVPQGGVGFNPGYSPMGGRTSPMPSRVSGRASPMPGGYSAMGGRTSPMPGGYNTMGGRTSPMPGGYNAMGGRTSPMPGNYGVGGRTSPMPGGGRTSPMPGGYNAMGGRASPAMPGPYSLGGRSSPMPGGNRY